jgi:hypothetical protein
MLKSDFLSLKVKDVIKGAILSTIVGVLGLIVDSLNVGEPIRWNTILTFSIITFLSYLSKNLFTDSVKEAQKTIIDAVKESEAPQRDKRDAIDTVASLKPLK